MWHLKARDYAVATKKSSQAREMRAGNASMMANIPLDGFPV